MMAAVRWLPLLWGMALWMGCSAAAAWESLDDRALAFVSGRGGVQFNLQGFALEGALGLTYATPSGDRLSLSNWSLSRSDDPDHLFDDPYSLFIESRGGHGADVIHFSLPQNAAGLQRWQFTSDLAVAAGGTAHDLGALLVQDLALYGGELTLSMPALADGGSGLAFGLSLRAELGGLTLRTRGRDDASDEMRLTGLRLGAVDATGHFTGQPWSLAHVTTQPGLFRALVDAKGPALQLMVDWSNSAAGAALGGLAIDNLRFSNDVAGVTDLGSSHIGSMQLNFVDIRLRTGS
jgi:hypothetical protein